MILLFALPHHFFYYASSMFYARAYSIRYNFTNSQNYMLTPFTPTTVVTGSSHMDSLVCVLHKLLPLQIRGSILTSASF